MVVVIDWMNHAGRKSDFPKEKQESYKDHQTERHPKKDPNCFERVQ